MQTQAAVLWDYGRDWEIEELTLDDPQEGEVLVRLAASGLCHSDEHLRIGDLPMEALPAIGGHEGAGVVEAVGPGVRSVAEGDHVVLSFIPACGRCHWCAIGRENLCEFGARASRSGSSATARARHHVRGEDARLMCILGTFSPVHGDQRGLRGQDRPGHPARQGGAGRVRRHHRRRHGHVRRRGQGRRHRRRDGRGRRRRQRGAGRAHRRRNADHRDRPGAVQPREAGQVRRHAHVRVGRGGDRADQGHDPRRDGQRGAGHRRRHDRAR